MIVFINVATIAELLPKKNSVRRFSLWVFILLFVLSLNLFYYRYLYIYMTLVFRE